MANYKITEEAEADLIRIHQWGVRNYGEVQADKYYSQFFERFEKIAKQPSLYPAVNDIEIGFRRSVCGVDSIYYKVENGMVVIVTIIGRQLLDSL